MYEYKLLVRVAVVLTLLLPTGCTTNAGPNESAGTLIGGATGAVLGSQFGKGNGQLIAVGIGALLGAHVGGAIGQKMDAVDQQLAAKTTQRTLENVPDNSAVTWKNPNNNHRGQIVVTNTTEDSSKVCRDYVHTVVIDGQEEKVHGRACRDVRDPKAQWLIKE